MQIDRPVVHVEKKALVKDSEMLTSHGIEDAALARVCDRRPAGTG
jgi:hypothetical protein